MKTRWFSRLLGVFATLLLPVAAQGHFQQLIPSDDIVGQSSPRELRLELQFTHPMAGGPAMAMASPIRFGVLSQAGREDLLDRLEPFNVDGQQAFRAGYRFKRPGNYLFYIEPAPYWEPAESKMIIHYTKVVVDAYDFLDGWDAEVGFPVEIDPLVRPYGLWVGNLFRGVVKQAGQPVPFATVEVAWRNDGSITAPAAAFVTQVIKADANGQFSYAMPRAGWWGFAALVEAAQPMANPDGELVPVEQGGLIWVRTREMK